MKTRLLLSVLFAVACTSAFAQTTVTGVNVTKFEATSRVKGYPARYTNFRNVKPSDTTIVYINNALSSGKSIKTISSTEAVQTETKQEVK